MIYLVVAASGFLISYLFYQTVISKTSVPPGLKEIPIERGQFLYGILKQIDSPFCNYLLKLSQKYGPIYRIKFGMREIVVLNTFEYIKEALLENGEMFSGRWNLQKYITMSNGSGIIFIDGSVWATQRSFVLKTLRYFGVGRSNAVEIVQNECGALLDELGKMKGKSVDLSTLTPIFTANVICKFIMNRRFTHKDPEMEIIEKMMAVVTNQDSVALLALMFPILDRNEWFMKLIIWITSRKSLYDDCHGMLEKEIEDHSRKLNSDSKGDDLIDTFLMKKNQLKEDNGQDDTFTNWQLVRNALELLIGGYDTTTTILIWSFMYMSIYPEVQERVQKEIIDNIGSERLPTMNDKVSLNYTQAVMDEIFRLSSIVPLAVMHKTLADVSVKGYFIPKDTLVIPNLFACHFDPNTWEKPLEFYPEHFLSLNVNNEWKYKSREELIPFGIGKRQCFGESLAKMEYFIFFTGILQTFRVTIPNQTLVKTNLNVLSGNDGLIRTTNIKDFIFTHRESLDSNL